MDDIAIKVENVSKVFKLPHEKNTSIKSKLINFSKRGYEMQNALEDVSFEVKKGDFFGIVGRNGSGKSTLLKILAGIYEPNKGNVQVNGSLIPFIELGVGFNPELTGRENVYLNGALLGFSRKEMQAKYEEIVEFAEIERFMDQKLKNYSSGMQVRLAFSIAIQAKGDILVLDEVLAVGDEAFQRKCINVFERYKAEKRTIILVTHDMSIVERFCSRAMLIKDSRVLKIGVPEEISQMYSEANKEDYLRKKRSDEKERSSKSGTKIEILNNKTKKPKDKFLQGESALIKLSWDSEGVKNAGIALVKSSGEYIFGPNTLQDNIVLKTGSKELFYTLELAVAAGEYYLMVGLFGDTDKDRVDFIDQGPTIIVDKNPGSNNWNGLTFLNHKWEE